MRRISDCQRQVQKTLSVTHLPFGQIEAAQRFQVLQLTVFQVRLAVDLQRFIEVVARGFPCAGVHEQLANPPWMKAVPRTSPISRARANASVSRTSAFSVWPVP